MGTERSGLVHPRRGTFFDPIIFPMEQSSGPMHLLLWDNLRSHDLPYGTIFRSYASSLVGQSSVP